MIDERHEELASLYAFDLLEGPERVQFETELARNPALQALVRELREASAHLAHPASTKPPPVLKARVLASIAEKAAATEPRSAKVIRTSPSTFRTFFPWAIAACFALVAAFVGIRFFTTNTELARLRQQHAIAEVALQSAKQQLEAERIITRRQFQDIDGQLNAAQTQLAQARKELEAENARLASLNTESGNRGRQLTETQQKLTATEQQLSDARRQAAERQRQVAQLTQQVNTLTSARTALDRELGEARTQLAKVTEEAKYQAALADFKITMLASQAKDRPQAHAVAVWDPKKQEGVLKVTGVPALPANQELQLWVVDAAYKDPVNGGTFTVDPKTGDATHTFKADQPVSAVSAFAVTRERRGGVPKAEGPMLLLGK